MTNLRIKKGDKIIVLTGKDKGKTGVIEKVLTKTSMIVVNGVNVVKKHTKATKQNPAGGISEVLKPFPSSKAQLICPSCNKATRVGYLKKGSTKERICKKCGKAIHAQKENPKGDK